MALGKYHISRDGIVRPCNAKNSCPLGGEEEHFNTIKSAQEYADQQNMKKYGVMGHVVPENDLDNETMQKIYIDEYSISKMKGLSMATINTDVERIDSFLKRKDIPKMLELSLRETRRELNEEVKERERQQEIARLEKARDKRIKEIRKREEEKRKKEEEKRDRTRSDNAKLNEGQDGCSGVSNPCGG